MLAWNRHRDRMNDTNVCHRVYTQIPRATRSVPSARGTTEPSALVVINVMMIITQI